MNIDENKDNGINNTIVAGPSSKGLDTSRNSSIVLGKRLFYHLNEWCKANSTYLIVTTTGWHNLSDAKSSEEPTKAFMSVADEYFRSINVPFFDISPDISELRAGNKEKYINQLLKQILKLKKELDVLLNITHKQNNSLENVSKLLNQKEAEAIGIMIIVGVVSFAAGVVVMLILK